MLSKKLLKELLVVTKQYPGGLVVLEENEPKFVILDYKTYRKIKDSPQGMQKKSARPRNILVTGGAGYIGSHTARLLVQNGHRVTTVDNLSTGYKEFAQGKLLEVDLRDKVALAQVFVNEHFDAVIHFAAVLEVGESVENPLKYYENNIRGGLNLLELAIEHGVKNLVFSSSCVVYDEHATVPINELAPIKALSPYGETKIIFENMLKWLASPAKINSVSLRYFNAAGASLDGSLGLANPNSSLLIPNVLNVALGKQDVLKIYGSDYKTHDGTAVRDYIHVLDLANAHLLALDYLFEQSGGDTICENFNVGTGKGYSVLEVINAACEITGHMVRFEMGPRRPGDRDKVVADAAKIKRVLGFEPQYSDLQTIISSAWAWHKKRFGS